MSLLTGFKILVVEADPDLREIVTGDFMMARAAVESAEHGQAGLKCIQLQLQRFDAVLTDMRMPNGDGRFLAKAVTEVRPR